MNMMNETKYLRNMRRKINNEIKLMSAKCKKYGVRMFELPRYERSERAGNRLIDLYRKGELLPYLISKEGYEEAHRTYRECFPNEYHSKISDFVKSVNMIFHSMIVLTVPHFDADGATMYFDSVYDVHRNKIKYDYEENPWYFYDFMLEQTGYMFEKELYFDMWPKLKAMQKQNPIWYKICEMKAHEDMYYALIVKEHQGRFKFIK